MSPGPRTRALLVGLAAGLAGGLFGVGGGIVMVPLLTGWLGTTQHQAHGTSLAATAATAAAALFVYGAHANVVWVTAALVGATSVISARYGARLAARLSSRHLAIAFAGFLVLVALRMLWRPPSGTPAFELGGPGAIALDAALGVAVGLLAGFMGVGGGILAVPAFTLLLGMPQQMAQGTSLAVILVTAPAGALEHARLGNLLGRVAAWMALGAAVGGALAAWLVQGLPREGLSRAFALFLLVSAAHTAWRASRKG